jgi:hypothetical protein
LDHVGLISFEDPRAQESCLGRFLPSGHQAAHCVRCKPDIVVDEENIVDVQRERMSNPDVVAFGIA